MERTRAAVLDRPNEPLGSTLPSDDGFDASRRSMRWRRVGVCLLSVAVAAGATGALGVRSATATGRNGPLSVVVRYAAVARPGLAVPFEVEVRRDDGFDGPVTVAVSNDYLDLFDENGVSPDPESSTGSPQESVLVLESPSTGEPLLADWDVRIEPGMQWGRSGWVRVRSGYAEVRVGFTTWLLP